MSLIPHMTQLILSSNCKWEIRYNRWL
jgi:hypothetical protein